MTHPARQPILIQGGMGVGVSDWRLARAVAARGQMGVVSGTALDTVLVRRLQGGDPGGAMRRALAAFPLPEVSTRVLTDYFQPEGKAFAKAFRPLPLPGMVLTQAEEELLVLSGFAEVWLAKAGHNGVVGVNFLEKVQTPLLPTLYGAMLAGVDFVLMGAGLPLAIPGVLDGLALGRAVELKLHVAGAPCDHGFACCFDPGAFWRRAGEASAPPVARPRFLAVISSAVAAKTLVRRASGEVDGFVVENHTAGGHNAPPRKSPGAPAGEAEAYGAKDLPDLAAIRDIGKPFWLAGSCASPAKVKEALALGANGVQVGTAFAYCRESGILPEIKARVLGLAKRGELKVETDFRASPTGYPFKVVPLANLTATPEENACRSRVCDLGYLREAFVDEDGKLGFRCSGEPVKAYVAKGGQEEDTCGRQCLCNGLLATVGLGQVRQGGAQKPIVTAGEDFSFVGWLLPGDRMEYGAGEVVDYLVG